MRIAVSLALAGLISSLAAAPGAQTLPPLDRWANRPAVPDGRPWTDPRVADMLRWLESEGAVVPNGANANDWMRFALRAHPQRRPTVDANENGKVSAEEAAAHAEAVFVSMDSDRNGALTRDEFLYHGATLPFPGFGSNPMGREARFKTMDGDSDGAISQGEFMAVARAHYEAARDPVTGDVTPWTYRRQAWY